MNRLWLILPAVVAFGCNDRDATDVKMNAGVAFASAREAASRAWDSVSREAVKITSESSHSALEQAKKQTARLQTELSKIEIKNPIDEAQLVAAHEQMAKIQAAINLKNLQEQSKQAVDSAIASGKIAQEKYEDASKKLAELDASYKDLKVKLDSAQQMYNNAATGWENAVQRVRELTGAS